MNRVLWKFPFPGLNTFQLLLKGLFFWQPFAIRGLVSIGGFVEIARISTQTIPDWQKLSDLYCNDTFTKLESYWLWYLMLFWYQAMPTDTRFVRYFSVLLGIGNYCLVLGSIVKVLSGIAKYHQVLQSIVRYYKVFSCIAKYHQVSQSIVGIVKYYQVSQSIVRYCQWLPQLNKKEPFYNFFFINFF